MAGSFIISFDFELHWGSIEKGDLAKKAEYFKNTRLIIPRVLEQFQERGIRATWATVGMLFTSNRKQLEAYLPKVRPHYKNAPVLNYYSMFEGNRIGLDEASDPLHFAGTLVKKIMETPGQDLGTHTFCHYYCNEPGQSIEQFQADLEAAQNIARDLYGCSLHSLVLPRNQYNTNYNEAAYRAGIKVIRTNPDVWFWKKRLPLLTLARAVDTLFPISPSLSFNKLELTKEGVLLLPASRFFRPYMHNEKMIRSLRLKRIKSEMLYAAKNNRHYHLWRHPHNFGHAVEENMVELIEILDYYDYLKMQYGFQSHHMLDMFENIQLSKC
ncbi:MAG: polysaccharide deacetylase family protein [Deltaproteobacteria bacterium]|nr:polysaccharide deacetylase family protein [Deltaproteobacteria bacterium]